MKRPFGEPTEGYPCKVPFHLCGFPAEDRFRARFSVRVNPFIVAVGRDFFHTFVTSTLRFRYRRVVPIYLVDDWVVNALGVFSGLVKLYATNFGGIDWDQTFQEFRAGRISTDR